MTWSGFVVLMNEINEVATYFLIKHNCVSGVFDEKIRIFGWFYMCRTSTQHSVTHATHGACVLKPPCVSMRYSTSRLTP